MANPTDQDARSKKIVRGIGSLSAQGVLGALLGFILLGTLLRYLPSLDFAAYSSVQVTVGLASSVSAFGLSFSVVKFLAPESTLVDSPGWGSARASILLSILFSGTTSLVLVLAAPFLSEYFLKGPSWAWAFYLGALWVFTTSISGTFMSVLQGMRRYNLLAGIVLASRIVAVGTAAVGLILLRSLDVALLTWVLYGTIISVAILLLTRSPLLGARAGSHFREVLAYATPLGLAGMISALAGNADIVVVGGYLDPSSLGVYNATIVISSVISVLFVGPLATALFAETSFSSETQSEVSKGTALALRFIALTVLPASLFAAAVASQLFELFSGGGSYARGIPFLALILVFYTFVAVQTVGISVLQGTRRTRNVLVVGVITAVGELGLSLSLVPGLGLAGAAYSRVLMMVVGCALSLYFVRDYAKGAINYRFLAKAATAAAVPTLTVFLSSVLISNRLATLLPYTLVGIGLYLLCAKGLTLLGDEDKSFLKDLLPGRLHWLVRLL